MGSYLTLEISHIWSPCKHEVPERGGKNVINCQDPCREGELRHLHCPSFTDKSYTNSSADFSVLLPFHVREAKLILQPERRLKSSIIASAASNEPATGRRASSISSACPESLHSSPPGVLQQNIHPADEVLSEAILLQAGLQEVPADGVMCLSEIEGQKNCRYFLVSNPPLRLLEPMDVVENASASDKAPLLHTNPGVHKGTNTTCHGLGYDLIDRGQQRNGPPIP